MQQSKLLDTTPDTCAIPMENNDFMVWKHLRVLIKHFLVPNSLPPKQGLETLDNHLKYSPYSRELGNTVPTKI